MFDRLLLLSEGRTIFLGPSHDAKAYFTSMGYPVPGYYNPADFYLDVLSPDNRTKEAEQSSAARILQLSQAWKEGLVVDRQANPSLHNNNSSINNSNGEGGSEDSNHNNIPGQGEVQVEYNSIKPLDQEMDFNRFVRTVKLLMYRSLSGQLRVPQALIARVIVSIAFGGIIGGMYSNMKKDQRGIQQLYVF